MGHSRYNTDMSFRSTQNTFFKQSQNHIATNGRNQETAKKSVDGQSNMFSFNGGKSVMSKRWNDIESTLKGKMSTNDHNRFNHGRKPHDSSNNLTSTQQ